MEAESNRGGTPPKSEAFYNQWSEPMGGSECPPYYLLPDMAKGSAPEQWMNHLSECKLCQETVETLRASEANRGASLLQFMRKAKELADESTAQNKSSLWKYLSGFYGSGRSWPVPVTAAVALLFGVLLTVPWGSEMTSVSVKLPTSGANSPREIDASIVHLKEITTEAKQLSSSEKTQENSLAREATDTSGALASKLSDLTPVDRAQIVNSELTLKEKLPEYSLQSVDSKKALIIINTCKSLDPASTHVKAVDDNSIQFSPGECRNLIDAEDKSGMRLAFQPNVPVAAKPSAAAAQR